MQAFFSVGIGQSGCLCDSYDGPYAISTRGEFVRVLRDSIDGYGLPASLLNEIPVKRLWTHAKRHGLSCISHEYFTPSMKCVFSLIGNTEAEYEAMLDAD